MIQITQVGRRTGLTCANARIVSLALDEYGLRNHLPTRPARLACYPVLVHRLVLLLHASFRPRLTAPPLHFANPSPPSGWVGDLHPQAVKHARHTKASRIDRPAT